MKKISIIAVALFVLASFAASDVAFAQVGYGGGSGSRARVEICHEGQTIKVARSAVAAHIANHGDTRGVCGATPQVLGAEKFVFNFNMNLGSTHPDVKKLQELLRKEGHFAFPTNTGYYGPLTQAAVKKYQATHTSIGFVTGYTGPLTRAVLNK